jgi:hypothetical protein
MAQISSMLHGLLEENSGEWMGVFVEWIEEGVDGGLEGEGWGNLQSSVYLKLDGEQRIFARRRAYYTSCTTFRNKTMLGWG